MTEDDDGLPSSSSLMAMLSEVMAKSKDTFRFDTETVVRVETPIPPAPLETLQVQEEQTQQLPPAVSAKLLPASDVQELIRRELPDFPERGVSITVYGFSPWNAMLNFGPGSISSRNATAMRKALVEIVVDLRTQVEVDIDEVTVAR